MTPTSPLRYLGRVVTGRFTGDDVAGVTFRHLALGLLVTCLAGAGRYWDHPRANALQRAGLGSVAYVLALSAFLWLLLLPLRPARWSYLHLITFIAAVSPPAFLYAIPVERFMSLNGARTANLWFLAIVAGWRVVLYVLLLMRYARFEGLRLFVAALLPLTIIVFSLTALNLERAVFDIMRGVDPGHGTAADSAYAVLVLVSILSIYLAPILVFLYFLAIGLVHHRVHE